MKELILFGTIHFNESNIPAQNRGVVAFIIDERHPQVVLEEWSEVQTAISGAAAVCRGKGVIWRSIGTPNTQEFATFDVSHAMGFPSSADIRRYGSIEVQEKREKTMCENISAAMSSVDIGLVVIGLAHLHSMFMKLSGEFEVDAYAFAMEKC